MKKKNLILLIGLSLTMGLTTSCSFIMPGEDNNNNNNGNETIPNKPIGIELVSKPNSYIYGDNTDFNNKFKVSVTYSNGEEKQTTYDETRKNGWYFSSLIGPDARPIANNIKNFTKLGKYNYTIGYAENSSLLTFNPEHPTPRGSFDVFGGSHTSVAPQRIDVSLTKNTYIVGELFDPSTIEAVGYWPNYGGNDTIDNEQLVVTGDGFDISKPFEVEEKLTINVSFRNIKATANLTILGIDESKKSKVDYTYNDYGTDVIYNTDVMSTTGNPKTLIVPIWFDDSPNYIKPSLKQEVKEMIEIAYLGTEEETGWHSVRSYYEIDSFHQLHIEGVVDDWYEYHVNSTEVNEDMTVALVKAVADNYKEKLRKAGRLSEWMDFDRDHDGFLDAVILIYGARNYQYYEANNLTVNENLWAYCFWVQDLEANKSDPVPNVFFWASFDFMLKDFDDPSPIIVDAHTYIHEMGHILGLDDYYDYTGKTMPAGLYTMQDANVGGHDPFSRLAYGWVDPFVPTKSETIMLKPFETSGEAIVLCPNWDGSAFNEYIILDYWTPDTLNELDCTYEYNQRGPKGPNTSGLRVWHVDARLARMIYDAQDESFVLNGKLTTKCLPGERVDLQMSNTTYNYANHKASTNGYCADIDALRRFDLLALLNHSESNSRSTYTFDEIFGEQHLWQPGDTFSMQEFKNSFPNVGKLDSNLDLGFTFEVLSKNADGILVNITKI